MFRTILALYDSSEDYNRREDNNLIHNNAEVILNYLGLRVRYHDIQEGLPKENALRGVLGIITWFQDDVMPNAEAYSEWAFRQILSGKKYIILGQFGALRDSQTNQLVEPLLLDQFYRALGVRYLGHWTDNPFVLEVLSKDSKMVEFERTLENEVGFYEQFVPLDSNVEVFLELKRSDLANSQSALVFTTPKGGFAYQSYDILLNYLDNQVRWRLNPFLFFEKALALEGVPKFDTTTLFGRRIFYAHIDGDGIRNLSEIGHNRMSGELIYDEILKKYSFPTTVSFITAEINPEYLGSDQMINLARNILALDNVEAGAHGFSHPLYWEEGVVSFDIPGYTERKPFRLNERSRKATEGSYYDDHAEESYRVKVPRELYYFRETTEAIGYINRYLVPQGERVVINQWTGDCEPPATAIDLVDHLGVLNINRGDTRFDRSLPSYTGVAPLTRQIDGRIQVHTSNSNENIYTDLWEAPFDRYSYVIETFQQTEYPTLIGASPRRLTPINAYYHFYIAEKKTSLPSLKEVLDYVSERDVIPIFTSEYVQIVMDFLRGSIKRRSDGSWRFSNYGQARTIRLDGEKRWPDLSKSLGVLGFRRWENSLFVHLSDKGEAILYLKENLPKRVYLEEASSIINNLSVQKGTIQFETKIHGEAYLRFVNLKPNTFYEVETNKGLMRTSLGWNKFRADQNGTLEIQLKGQGHRYVSIA